MTSIINLPPVLPPQAEKSTKQEFIAAWRGRELYRELGLNDPRVQHIAFRALGLLTAAAAATLLVLSISGIAIVGQYVIIPLCIITSIFSFLRAQTISYQQESRALESLHKDIAQLSLKEIVSEYSWNQLFVRGILSPEEFANRYRQQIAPMTIPQAVSFYEKTVKRLANCPSPKHVYHIPLPSELKDKWIEETKDKTFEQIIDTYPIAKLHKYHILSEREFGLMTELEAIYQTIKNERVRDLYLYFPQEEVRKQELEGGFAEIEAAYRKEPAVQRLEAIDAEFYVKRDEITNRYAQLVKQEMDIANAPCQEHLKKHPELCVHWIKKELRDEFEGLKKARKEKEQEINARLERARNAEIALLEEQYGVERLQLSITVQALKAKREAQIADLQTKIQDSTASDTQIEERFQNLMKDLNAQFTARRYVLKAGL